MVTIEHFEIVEFPKFIRGFVLVCGKCRFVPGLGKWTLQGHSHRKSWKNMKACIEAKKKEIGEIIKPETLASEVLLHLHGEPKYHFLKTEVGFACSYCDNKTITETTARKHKQEEHGDQGDIRRVEMQSFYRGQKSQYFIVGEIVHGNGPTDNIHCGKAPNSPSEGQTPMLLATDGGRKIGLGEIGLINGTTSASAIESPPRTASPGGRQEIAQKNGGRASSTEMPPNFGQPTDRRRLPFNGFWDRESEVPTYQPSKEEFSDFANFMRNITGSEEFTSIGVAMIKVPPGR
ncbi:MAG: hypothetical protein M1840_000838 [Geoglossum simile]|nr:MAG: hypothetical protein M1840_000838 [Geoglossum simile]